MTPERTLLVFHAIKLAIEFKRKGQDIVLLAEQYGARQQVTRDEIREVLKLTVQEIAERIHG